MAEHGEMKRAETIFQGLTEVAPQFAPAFIGMALVQFQAGQQELASQSIKQALKIAPQSTEALLFLIACLLTSGDFSSAGTYLGEVGEMIEEGEVEDPSHIRFFKLQLARYQNRA
jgi:thioredoxin-like negative regulator of GroEL